MPNAPFLMMLRPFKIATSARLDGFVLTECVERRRGCGGAGLRDRVHQGLIQRALGMLTLRFR